MRYGTKSFGKVKFAITVDKADSNTEQTFSEPDSLLFF